MATDVVELHGDRLFGDDAAIVGGFCRLDGRRVVFVGHQKGAETNENIRRNFGMPHPEGYRKAMRLFTLAERLRLPVVTFVDTPGAFPGPASEERGVAEAIARSIMLMTRLRTPIVTVITGEGGSGGALAIAVGDVVLALENAIYSVISPEGCAEHPVAHAGQRPAGGRGHAPDRARAAGARRDRRGRRRAGGRRARERGRDGAPAEVAPSLPSSTRSPAAIRQVLLDAALRPLPADGRVHHGHAQRRRQSRTGQPGRPPARALRVRPRRHRGRRRAAQAVPRAATKKSRRCARRSRWRSQTDGPTVKRRPIRM